MVRILRHASAMAAVILLTACSHTGGNSANPTGNPGVTAAGQPASAKTKPSVGSATPDAIASRRPHNAPPLSSLKPCSLFPFAMAQSLTASQLDPTVQPAENPATGETGCTWLTTSSGPTVGLTIWQNPPPANNYGAQFAQAKYLAAAKRCPGAYYRAIPSLGDAAFASYCTTNSYSTDNEQSVTWQYGNLLLSVGVLGDSTAQDRISALTAIASKINSKL